MVAFAGKAISGQQSAVSNQHSALSILVGPLKHLWNAEERRKRRFRASIWLNRSWC